MASLSTQNRCRIINCLKTISTAVHDDSDLTKQALAATLHAEMLHSELASNRLADKDIKPRVDQEFVDSYMSSGSFANDLGVLREAEGAAWGNTDLQTLAECVKDIPLTLTPSQQEYFNLVV